MSRDHWTAPLAALATVLTMWSMSPVVDGAQWQAPCLLAVLVVLVVGVLLRLARLPGLLVAAGQLVAGAMALTAYFVGGDAILGVLPGPAALDRLRVLVIDGGDTMHRYAAPVPTTQGLMLFIAAGVLAIAVLVDVSAVTLRSPAAAGLPLLALYCVPSAVVPGGLSWRYFAAGAAGWLLLLAHEASGQVLRWGRLLPRWGGPGTGTRESVAGDTGALAATGRRLGAAAVALAVFVPALAPGLSEGLLTRGGQGGSDRLDGLTVINPVLTLRDNLTPRRDVEVLRYRTTQADVAPLRIVTADRFDGRTWTPGTTDVSRRQRANKGLPAPPGLSRGVSATPYTMHVDVGSTLDQDFLPLPYPTRRVRIDGAWLYDATSLNVVGDGETVRNTSYDAEYLAVRPTVAQLRASGPPPDKVRSAYTRLPGSLPDVVRTTAATLTKDANSQYDKAMALQQWFRETGNFTYSTDAPADSGGDAVADFLVDRKGFCVQFSSAMAVMARTLGIPARIAVGFLPGTPERDDWWSVKLTDAHAWPELYFAGVGWVRFEPTPATRSGAAPNWAQVAATAPGGSTDPQNPTPADGASADSDPGNPKTRQLDKLDQQAPGGSTLDPLVVAAGGAAGSSMPWQLAGGLVVLLLAGLLAPASSVLGRRRRRRAATDDAARVEAAWADLHERVDDLGLGLPVGTTPRQLDARLAVVAGLPEPSRAALARVSTVVERTRYARQAVDISRLDADLREVLRAMATTRSPGQRLRALALPRSGTARLSGWADRVARRLGGVDLGVAQRARRVIRRRR